MLMYPSYRLRDVLDEYAITFFALLEEGYRQKHKHYQMMANIVSLPYVDSEARAKFNKTLQWATQDPSDILNDEGDETAISDLKKMLG